MKTRYFAIFLLFPVLASAQDPYWQDDPDRDAWWIVARRLEPYQMGNFTFTPVEVKAGVPEEELDYYGLPHMAGGTPLARYFFFSGEYNVFPYYDRHITFGWPGGIIEVEDLIPLYPNRIRVSYSFICGCFGVSEDPNPPDSARLANAIGYWYFVWRPPPEWPYWDGYTCSVMHAHPCIVHPCPGGDFEEKREFVFADSLYNDLPENALLSGDSRLYLRADRPPDYQTAYVKLSLETNPDRDTVITLIYHGDDTWRGTLENSRLLGLKSFNRVKGELYVVWPDSTEHFRDDDYVDVGIPVIHPSADTVIIDTESMNIRDDFIASLYFEDDHTGELISAANRIDSAGFRYRSLWVSNTSYDKTKYHKPYRRYYPSDSTYLSWDWNPNSCEVTFWSDSLYVVGGSLSVDCVGALNGIPNIDNSFSATTDTVINDTTRATKLIMVDQDPSNILFRDTLRTDRIRAVAWQEYAGSNDPSHCHDPYNPRWNHYWDIRIAGADTCIDSRFPCENRYGLDTGIMQIYRQGIGWGWEPFFERPDSWPTGYSQASWDSLTWLWHLNVFNGIYIHDIYMPAKFKPEQRLFPDSCSFADCDTFPLNRNKEDLKTYGYHRGDPRMREIISQKDWDEMIADTSRFREEYSIYVQNVRKFRYQRPWEE